MNKNIDISDEEYVQFLNAKYKNKLNENISQDDMSLWTEEDWFAYLCRDGVLTEKDAFSEFDKILNEE